jgi:putative hydrolase of the HAD superfamily
MIELIGLDGDDTLWRNEDYFTVTQDRFGELLGPYLPTGIDVQRALETTERRNLEVFGYGAKGFTLSLIETAIELTDGRVPAAIIQELVGFGRWILTHPVELLEGVADVVTELSTSGRRLVIVTKGDLMHQEQKVAGSGLADLFDAIEIVSEKDEPTYRRLLERAHVSADRFVMVGNSVRSDVLPVLAIGGRAVHIPYHTTWAHEHADHDGAVPTLASIRDLPAWLDALSPIH